MPDRLDDLEARLKNLEVAFEAERAINAQQAETIAQQAEAIAVRQRALIRHEQQTRRGLEVLTVAVLGFLGFCLVILTGLKLQFGWGTFELPANLLESATLSAGVAAIAKYALDRRRSEPPAA